MEYFSLLLLGTLSAALHGASASEDGNEANTTAETTTERTIVNTIPPPHLFKDYYGIAMKRAVAKKCSENYSILCLKVDILKMVDRLYSKGTFEILPGLYFIKDANRSTESAGIPPSLASDIIRGAKNSSRKIDELLHSKMVNLFKSFYIQIQIDEDDFTETMRNTGDEIMESISPDSSRKGRSKKGALIWSAGVLAALGFAAMAAVTGKALMASLLALIIAAFSALRGSSGMAGYKTAHYEIITKPVHYAQPAFTGPAHYYDHDHVQGLHSNSYSPAYDYARTMTAEAQPSFTSKSFTPTASASSNGKNISNELRPRMSNDSRNS